MRALSSLPLAALQVFVYPFPTWHGADEFHPFAYSASSWEQYRVRELLQLPAKLAQALPRLRVLCLAHTVPCFLQGPHEKLMAVIKMRREMFNLVDPPHLQWWVVPNGAEGQRIPNEVCSADGQRALALAENPSWDPSEGHIGRSSLH